MEFSTLNLFLEMDHELYKEHILDHYKNPLNKYALLDADFVGKESNTICGDEVTVYVNQDESGIVTEISFTGDGCAISQAAASLFTEFAKGKHIEDIRRMQKSDVEQLLGISLSTVRVRCALLIIHALQNVQS